MKAAQYLSPRTRRGVAALALLSLPIGFAAHTTREGARAIEASDSAAARGDLDFAIVEARRAATDDVPLVGHQDEGYDRLESIARAAEARGDQDRALRAWSAEHAAALATSGLRKHAARLATSSAALAHLYKLRVEQANEAGANGPGGAVDETKLAADLSRDETPVGRAVAIGLGSAVLALAAIALMWESRRRARPAPTAPGGSP